MQDGEVQQKLKLEARDTETIKRFYSHFNLTLPDSLKDAMKAFEQSQTLETERNLILAMTQDTARLKTELAQLDDLFLDVADACADASYDLQFDKDFEEAIGRSPEELTQMNQASSEQKQGVVTAAEVESLQQALSASSQGSSDPQET